MIRSFYTIYNGKALYRLKINKFLQPQYLSKGRNLFFLIGMYSLISGCTMIISSATNNLANNLSSTILNSNDPQTVADGAPAYLLLVSSFLNDGADDEALLRTSATLHSAYASVFIKDPARASKMTSKAFDYARQAVCLSNSELCDMRKMPFPELQKALLVLTKNDVANWYTLGTSWAGWIQANSKDWNAIADLARVKVIFARLLQLEPTYKQGGVHLYLAGLSTLLPPALGGKPEIGKKHFEKAIALSNNKNLMAKVLYAEKYAKLLFKKGLHDKLLNEVLAADPIATDLTLMNTLAQDKAKDLLAASDDYF